MIMALVLLAAVAAGLIQGVTGFGAGIVLMVVLPQLFPVVQSAGMSQAITVVLTVVMAWHYRKHINVRKIVAPAVLFIACSWTSLLFANAVDQTVMKLILGVFLVLLAGYFLFVQQGEVERLGMAASLFCIAFSGVCDGMFGIGGPLMVVYYLFKTADKEEYLGTIQAFFFICVTAGLGMRLYTGALDLALWPMIAAGACCVLVGLAVANRVVEKLNDALVRKLTYWVIGLAGAYNAVVSILALAS